MPYQRYAETERKYNRPMDELLLDFLNQYGIEGTAKRFGVTENAVWRWSRRAGLRHVCQWVKGNAAEAKSA